MRVRVRVRWGDDRCGIENEDPPTGVVGKICFLDLVLAPFLDAPGLKKPAKVRKAIS